ncbi:MAG: hypothetical protein ACKVPY_15640 [Paracoccaceae bacterium]
MRLIDPDHPFFRPVWARWVTTILPLLWAGFEFWNGSPGWAAIFGAAGIYVGYALLIVGPTKG